MIVNTAGGWRLIFNECIQGTFPHLSNYSDYQPCQQGPLSIDQQTPLHTKLFVQIIVQNFKIGMTTKL